MIKNCKLTLEQRIARLEKLLKAERCVGKNEGGPIKDSLLADSKELRARLKMKNVFEPKVTIDGEYIVVTLDWDYFGLVDFRVLQTAKGYNVECDQDADGIKFCRTLDRVADYIADKNYEAAMDL